MSGRAESWINSDLNVNTNSLERKLLRSRKFLPFQEASSVSDFFYLLRMCLTWSRLWNFCLQDSFRLLAVFFQDLLSHVKPGVIDEWSYVGSSLREADVSTRFKKCQDKVACAGSKCTFRYCNLKDSCQWWQRELSVISCFSRVKFPSCQSQIANWFPPSTVRITHEPLLIINRRFVCRIRLPNVRILRGG